MTPELIHVEGKWHWITDEGMKPLTPHEVEELKEGAFHDERA